MIGEWRNIFWGPAAISLIIVGCDGGSFSAGGGQQSPKPLPTQVQPQNGQSTNQNQYAQPQGQNCQGQNVQRFTGTVVFEAREGCEWGTSGNGPKRNMFFQARHEHNKSLQVPAYSKICDMSIVSKESNFVYDDLFFLTLNGNILIASDADAIGFFQKNQEMYAWDFLKLKEQFMTPEIVEGPPYCLGNTVNKCTVPAHNKEGAIKISLDPEAVLKLSNSIGGGVLNFGLVTTGDDNPNPNPAPSIIPGLVLDDDPNAIDCRHSQLTLDVNMSYYN